MTETHTVRVGGPGDLLALVPAVLGFHPQDSVVVLTVGDAAHRFHARADLPDDPVGIEELATYLARVAGWHGLSRAATVLYTADAGLADAVAGELAGRLAGSGVRLVCAIRADGERWWRCDGAPDAPGTPYDLSSHPLLASAALEGRLVLSSRRELDDSLVGDPRAAAGVDALAAELVTRLADDLDRATPERRRRRLVAEGHWLRGRVRGALADGGALGGPDLARLLTLLSVSLELRDVAWAEMTHDNAGRHVALWLDAVRRAPVHLRAAPAALLGFAAWLSGQGALAWCAVDCARAAEPDYGLAELLGQALAGAVPPSAWQPIPAEALTLFGP